MNITIQIHYTSTYDSKITQGGSFPVNAHQSERDLVREAARGAFYMVENH